MHPTKAWLSQLVNFKNAILDVRTLFEERYAIKFCSKLGKNATETYGMLQTAFWSILHELSISFLSGIRDSRKVGSLWGMMRGVGGVRKINTQELIGQRVRVTMLSFLREFRKRFLSEEASTLQIGLWHFHLDNAPVHNSILVTDYLTKMCIKTVPHPPYSPDLAPYDFWLFSKLREPVVMRQLMRWKRLWWRSLTCSHKKTSMGPSRSCWNGTNKCIAAEGDYLEGY